MSKHNYKYFDKKQPTKTYSTSLGDVKDIDEMYNDLGLDEKNEVATEPEVVEERKITSVIYKNKEYPIKDVWHDGMVIVLSNMRAEPNTDSNVLAVLAEGKAIKINDKQANDEFYKIKFGDTIGYMKKELCKITS